MQDGKIERAERHSQETLLGHCSVERVGTLFNSNQGGGVYSTEGIAPNLCAAFHGYANGYIVLYRRKLLEGNNPGEQYAEAQKAVGGRV